MACYNFDMIHQPTLIIFGRNVAKKASSQLILSLPISPSYNASAPDETESRKLRHSLKR